MGTVVKAFFLLAGNSPAGHPLITDRRIIMKRTYKILSGIALIASLGIATPSMRTAAALVRNFAWQCPA